jgi:hypothetical protein
MSGKWFQAGFGVLWIVMAVGITQSMPDHRPFSIAKVVFPLFGLLFVIRAITMKDPAAKEDDTGRTGNAPRHRSPGAAGTRLRMQCPSCGDTARGEDVSPEGSAKCRSCGNWFKVAGPTGNP